jgi:hypothetical protein
LVLISKVLQAIGNQAEFGEKEMYMIPFNHFVVEGFPKMMKFINQLTVIESHFKYSNPEFRQ